MSAGSPAQHEKAHITKDHICQRFGAEGKGEALYCISKVQTQSWAFQHIYSSSSSSRADASWQLSIDSLFSGRHGDITSDRKGDGKKRRQLKGARSMHVMTGHLCWVASDQIIQLFFQLLFRPCVRDMAACVPEAFSTLLPKFACTGKSVI